MGRKRKYQTEEERKAAQRESKRKYQAKYRENNKEKVLLSQKQWRDKNIEKCKEYDLEYRKTPMGRAKGLLNNYRQADEKYNRGECTLTPEWIVENIFSKPCVYCGKTDWHELGCDRKYNSLPHTPDNVVPCCKECNTKKSCHTYRDYMRMINKVIKD